MAKKRQKPKYNQPADLLGNVNTAENKTPQRPNDQKLAGYRIGTDTIELVNQTAQKYNVQKSDLVKFLLEAAIPLLEQGVISFEYEEEAKPRNIKF